MYSFNYNEIFKQYNYSPRGLASLEMELHLLSDCVTGDFRLGSEIDNATGWFRNEDELMHKDTERVMKSVGDKQTADMNFYRRGLPTGLISINVGEVIEERLGALEFLTIVNPINVQMEHIVPNGYMTEILLYMLYQNLWKIDKVEYIKNKGKDNEIRCEKKLGVHSRHHNIIAQMIVENNRTTFVTTKENSDLRKVLKVWEKQYIVDTGRGKDYSKLLEKLHKMEHYKEVGIRFYPPAKRIKRGIKAKKGIVCYPNTITEFEEALITDGVKPAQVKRDYKF
jgi:hypothetical protein